MARKCNCSGPCGPQFVSGDAQAAEGVSRREFIALSALGSTGAIVAASPAEAEIQRAKDLAAWKTDLHKASAPTRYRSDVHLDARMHLGGIGTGNFEIGSDGRFTTWQLFNTLRDGYIPLFFGVRCGKEAKMLQTSGGPAGIPHVQQIEMTGEYPIAKLRFLDNELPIETELTAFTPFAPLDVDVSSMPAACFVFKLTNRGTAPKEVSLGAFMQNPVGYDAMGVPISFNSVGFNVVEARYTGSHPNFGGNINEAISTDHGAMLSMRAQAAKPMTIDQPLQISTNLPAGMFDTPYEGRPLGQTVHGLDRIPADASQPIQNAPPSNLIWLEDAGLDISAETLARVLQAVEQGAILLISGTKMPLLQHYGEVTNGKPLDSANLKPDILFDDFEQGYANWTVEGAAFGVKPAAGTLAGQQQVSGYNGKQLVNSFLNGDEPTGRMTSKPFTIERNYVRFLVGGGSHPTTQIRLRVNGRVVRATSGKDEERLLPAFWDVREFLGQTAQIEIVDEEKTGWGHINVDDIVFGDLPGSAETLRLLERLLPIRFRAVRTLPATADTPAHVEFLDRTMAPDSTEREWTYDNSPYLERGVGKGRVLLMPRSQLHADEIELLGARRRAYRRLASFAGNTIRGGEGSPEHAPGYGSLVLGALGEGCSLAREFTDWQSVWAKFASSGNFDMGMSQPYPTQAGSTVNGAIARTVTVPAGKTVEVEMYLAWHYPNKYSGDGKPMGNHYTTRWANARAVADEITARFKVLRERTERFRSVFYDSTLPYWMLDCLTSQASTIRHVGVLFRIGNGETYAWEGSNGCCDPTCTHVWGYVQNVARLFPDLERSMRQIDLKCQQRPDGGVNNRTAVPSPGRPTGEQPFADGHCSTVLKGYREALNAGGDAFLKEYYPNLRRAVEYLIDRDAATSGGVPNGLLEDAQWNTYDEALHGVSGFIGSYYLAALRAGEEMAKRQGDAAFAKRCRTVFDAGQANLIAKCWNGEYFEQHLPGYEAMSGEVGPGCMADQMIGQWWAHQLGLGYLLPAAMVRSSLRAVFKHNWMSDLTGWKHSPRAFAGDRDKGLVICTWPRGGRPPRVMLYSDEVWTGIEYQVAGHMAYEGMIDEAFAVVKGARDRYNGVPRRPIPRSPWNEIECGGHYARAGASWSLLLALSGWHYDGITRQLIFRPRHTPERFKSFFSGPEGWGSIAQERIGNRQVSSVHVVEGALPISRIGISGFRGASKLDVRLAGKATHAVLHKESSGPYIQFTSPIILQHGQTLTAALG